MHRARDLALAMLPLLLSACGPAADAPAAEPPGLGKAEAAIDGGRPGEALREIASIVPESLVSPRQRLRAARVASRARDWARAARLLARDAEAAPAGEAALLRAEALLRTGDLDAGARAIAAAGEPPPERARVLRAMLAVARGRADEAARGLEALARDGTRDPDAWVLLAQAALPDAAEAERRLLDGARACDGAAPIQSALGRLALRAGRADRAIDALAPAVRARPWDREARLDLARARVATGRDPELDLAIEDLRRVVADAPAEFDPRLRLAEALGEKGVRITRRLNDGPEGAQEEFAASLALYEALAAEAAPDPESAVSVLLGQARVLIECIPLDRPEVATAPGSRFRRAEAALARAEALDPQGRLLDANGVRLLAENWYLRGRANKRAHVGSRDHAESVGWYAKAVQADPRHLEAPWDLALIEYDHLRTPEYVREAARHVEAHLAERKRRGMAEPDESRMRIVRDIRRRAALGIGFPAGESTPD
jgi:tetratricopeptide (TPR) repeat protein